MRQPYEKAKSETEAALQFSLYELLTSRRGNDARIHGSVRIEETVADRFLDLCFFSPPETLIVEVKKDFSNLPAALRQVDFYKREVELHTLQNRDSKFGSVQHWFIAARGSPTISQIKASKDKGVNLLACDDDGEGHDIWFWYMLYPNMLEPINWYFNRSDLYDSRFREWLDHGVSTDERWKEIRAKDKELLSQATDFRAVATEEDDLPLQAALKTIMEQGAGTLAEIINEVCITAPHLLTNNNIATMRRITKALRKIGCTPHVNAQRRRVWVCSEEDT